MPIAATNATQMTGRAKVEADDTAPLARTTSSVTSVTSTTTPYPRTALFETGIRPSETRATMNRRNGQKTGIAKLIYHAAGEFMKIPFNVDA